MANTNTNTPAPAAAAAAAAPAPAAPKAPAKPAAPKAAKAPRKAPAKRTPKAAGPKAPKGASPLVQAVAKALAAAPAAQPGAPLYAQGKLYPVRPGTHRAYAQAVIAACTALLPGGYTLAQYRAALVGAQAAYVHTPPKAGWARHNMPTWAHTGAGWHAPNGKAVPVA